MKQKSTKVEFNGVVFDSKTELRYYQFLLSVAEQANIIDIEIHPCFEIIPAHYYECPLCYGAQKKLNKQTGNMNQCPKCKGKGHIKKKPTYYTPDFIVHYLDGRKKVIDVKGYANESFPLRKTLFQAVHKKCVVVVEWHKIKGWVEKF
jgi:Protein of unknown function (DUF1064)